MFASHIITAPRNELHLVLLEIHGAALAAPLRFAESIDDWTVTLENGEIATFFGWTGFEADTSGSDDSGMDERSLRVPDVDRVLWRAVQRNIGSAEPLYVIVREYLSTDLTAPISSRLFELSAPSREIGGSAVTFTASSVDPNLCMSAERYTWDNSPGLRR